MFVPLILVSACLAACAKGDVVIHGYSVLISPSESSHPRDANFSASNFFSYGSEKGYLSFGWFFPVGSDIDTSHFTPDSEDYDWYEYSSGNCSLQQCLVYAKNYDVHQPRVPAFESDYNVRTAKIGSEPWATLALSYFDEQNGAYAVGSRTLLGLDGLEVGKSEECNKAFATIQNIEKRHKVPLDFELRNPCSQTEIGLVDQRNDL